MKKIIFGSLALLYLASGLSFFLPKYSQPPHRISAEVLGAQVGHFVIPPSPTPVPTPTPKEETTEEKYTKTSYAIAVYGDSMVDTMGERLEYLEGALKKLYPGINFNLYNFGKGSEAEISPLRENFGKGPNGVNWDQRAAFVHSGNILEQLENAVGLAKSLNVPLIDAFTKSGGNSLYVNPSDGIHPSVLGHEFTASLIAQTIKLW